MTDTRFLLQAASICALLVIGACADDAPDDVDASTSCQCPAAEPPLDGRIVKIVTETPIEKDTQLASGTAFCPMAATILGGGCSAKTPSGEMVLLGSVPGEDPEAFVCRYRNNSAVNDNVIVTIATCLVPSE